MNEQVEKIIYDFKQSLGQQSFYTFELLNKHLAQESSRDLVIEEIDRIKSQFSADSPVDNTSIDELEGNLSKEIMNANKKGDLTRVMEIEDDLYAIRRVKSLMSGTERK